MRRRPQRILLHVDDGRRVPVEFDEVFLLEAAGNGTIVRTRGRRVLHDTRGLTEVLARFPAGLLEKIHRAWAVNIDRITEVRRDGVGRDWELKLEPPVNRVLPISRRRLADLWAAFGEG